MEKVKTELTKCIKGLHKKARFNIIKFNSSCMIWKQKGLVYASDKNKTEAEKYIAQMSPAGNTYTYGSLEMAFKDLNTDTIILLTDGHPTIAKSGPAANQQPKAGNLMDEVIAFVKKANRHRKVKIFTYGFKSMEAGGKAGSAVDFLKRLASENQGTYTGI